MKGERQVLLFVYFFYEKIIYYLINLFDQVASCGSTECAQNRKLLTVNNQELQAP